MLMSLESIAVAGVASACVHGVAWPELEESTPCGLCYTSRTTGNPKVRVVQQLRYTALLVCWCCQCSVFQGSLRCLME
jgi:acyl-coenzyme A synthetase/AMP-(fatty) acid ligase